MNSIQMAIRGLHGFSQTVKTRFVPRRVGWIFFKDAMYDE